MATEVLMPALSPTMTEGKIARWLKSEGEPVNPATGEVFSTHVDFTLSGILPLVFERNWTSTSNHIGELGHGWHHTLDMALGGRTGRPGWTLRLADGRLADLDPPRAGRPSLNVAERMQLWTDGDALWVTDYDGRRYDFGPRCSDGLRRLTAIRDANGNAVLLRRDDRGDLVSVTGGGGRRLTVTRDTANRIVRIDGPAPEGEGQAPLVAFIYDSAGNLVGTQDAAGAGFRYGYVNHLLTAIRWPAGAEFTFAYDDPGRGNAARCVETTGANDLFLRRLEYDTVARTTTVRDGRGATRVYKIDAAGRVIAQTDGLGRETRFERDENHRVVKETRADGAERTWHYDEMGRMAAATRFDGAETTLAYPPAFPGQPIRRDPVRISEPGGRIHTFAYDQRGNQIEYLDPMGGRHHFLRGGDGLPLAIRDDLGVRRLYRWTSDGRLEREATSRGTRHEFAYDRLGRMIAFRRTGEQPVRFRRDPVGNIVEISRADGGRVVMGYDAERHLTLRRDANGAETRWEYEGLPYPMRRVNPDGTVLSYRFDSELNLVGLVNAKGEEYRLAYNLAGQLADEVGFDGRRRSYAYDAAGYLASLADAEGRGATFRRDPLGRLLEQVFADGTTDRFERDATGLLTKATNSARSVEFRYNRAGAVIEEHQDIHVARHEYDVRGRRTATELPEGRRITYEWGEDDTFVGLGFGGRQLAAITRDILGRETDRRVGTVMVESAYDPQGRLRRQAATRAGTHVLERAYEYDVADRVLAIEDILAGTRRYAYDPCDQLVGVTGDLPESFDFDPAGNILGESRQVGAVAPGDRLTMYGDRKFEYDGCGNRVREVRGAGGGVEVLYKYGPNNQLVAVEERNRRGIRRTSFTYDALGRRVGKHYLQSLPAAANDGGGAASEVATDVQFLWDGDRLLAEGPAAGDALDTVYLHEPGTFRPLAMVRHGRAGTNEVGHYHLDHLGTPREVTNDNGEVIWQASLKAWGTVAKIGVAAVSNQLRFQGQYHDIETGLHYNRFRYYSPEEGRFVHEDPFGLAGGENLAAYAPNPLRWVDPFGLVGDPATATHITYLGVDAATGKPYVGYASMQGVQDPQAVLSYRYGGNYDRFGGTAPEVVYSGYGTEGKATARGLEQHYFESFGGLEGTANKQNPVGEGNPKREQYTDAAEEWVEKDSSSGGTGGCG